MIIQVVNVILRVELCEDTIDVFGRLSTKVCDVKAHKLWWDIVVGRHNNLDVFLAVRLCQGEDLLRCQHLVVGQEIEGIQGSHLIHGTNHIHWY